MSTFATLAYTITPVPPLSLSRLETAVAAVPLSVQDPANFGAVFVSDSTTNDGTSAIRTIVYNIASAAFQKNFPSASNQQASMFNNLFTHELGGALSLVVIASPVVIV